MSPFHWSTVVAAGGIASVLAFAPHGMRMLASCAIATAWAMLFAFGVADIRMRWFTPSICRAAAAGRRIALTFDDGPDPRATVPLLDALRELGVPAAFFCIGRRLEAHPEIARRIADEGHVIGNHTFNHSNWTNFFGFGRMNREILDTQDSIQRITGKRPRFYRPPMGLTQPIVDKVVRRIGMKIVGWQFRGLDRGAAAERVVARVTSNVRDGSIVVLHDGGADPERLVRIVREVAATLRARGYSFVRLDELIGEEPWQDA